MNNVCDPQYIQQAKQRLVAHGIGSCADLAFKQDPKQQDKRTTWIEYLLYECGATSAWKRREPWYQRQWDDLMSSGVLERHETEGSVLAIFLDPDSPYYKEIPLAETDLELAESETSSHFSRRKARSDCGAPCPDR